MKFYFILSTLVLSFVMLNEYSYGEELLVQHDPIEKLEEERREIYGDPEEEREQYYKEIHMPDINGGSDYLLKDHPLQEKPLEEEPIPDNPLQENPIPQRPLDEQLIR